MKRKLISNTYLRDIEKYEFKLYLDEDELLEAHKIGEMPDD